MRPRRRVVVTGMGVVTPIGIGVEAFWQAMMEGRSGVGTITRFDASGMDCRIAAEVKDFDPERYMDKKDARRADRFAQMGVAAAAMALEDAGFTGRPLPEELGLRTGVLIGSGVGGIATFEEQCRNLILKGPGRVSPFTVPMMIADMASGLVSIFFGARGYNSCSVSACASGSHAIGDAFRIVERGDADVMIAGGCEAAIVPVAIAAFSSAKALSTRNEDPAHASRPFDKDRDGFVMGEGAGVLVLEEREHALRRGARIHAELVGYGATADAYHMTAPDPQGDGAARAMLAAVRDAGLAPEDVQYINAHGTSTAYNDQFETAAIKRALGEHAYRIAVSSTKSMVGHLLGAAGGVEAVATILAIERGFIPPTINYETPDPACDLDYVPNRPRKAELRVALSNSFGFGGHNAVLAFARHEAA